MTASIKSEAGVELRSWVYGAMVKGFSTEHCKGVLHKYVNGMDEFYATAPAAAEEAGWKAEKRALRLLYAELLGIERTGASAPAVAAPVAPAGSLPNGTYTVVMGDEYRTIRLRDDWRDDAPAGSQVAQFLSGSDNTNDFTGFAFVSGRTARVWKKWAGSPVLGNALTVLLAAGTEERAAMGEAYALASGRCWRCNRVLTTPESISLGIGPECRKQIAA